jgi:hypothetical protein
VEGASLENRATALIVDDRVGIGTTSPGVSLDVSGKIKSFQSNTSTTQTSDNAGGEIRLRNTSDTDNNFSAITLQDADDGTNISRIAFVGDDHSANKGSINMYTANGSGLVRRLRLTNNGEIWLADGGGNVGIGTTGPVSPLQIDGSVASIGQLTLGSDGINGVIDVYESLYINIDSRDTVTDRIFSVNTNGTGEGAGTQLFQIEEDGNATFSGNVLPSANNSKDLGSPSARWANVYAGDLHLKNETGDWTVVEGEEELFLHNNLTGKKYAIMMREIE